MKSTNHITPSDVPNVEVAVVPSNSRWASAVKEAAKLCGASFVAVDEVTPTTLSERIFVLDLSNSVAASTPGPRAIAISANQSLSCFDVIHPNEVQYRLQRSLANLVEMEQLKVRVTQGQATVSTLNDIGLTLSAITERKELLEAILSHSRRVLSADGGTIYLRDGDELIFEAAQNDSVEITMQREKVKLPIEDSSLAGFVAGRNTILNIDDIYNIPKAMPYSPNFTFDKASGYRTRSMLLVPMTDRDNKVLGVLAFVNRKPTSGVPLVDFSLCQPFSKQSSELACSIASQAAVALENYRLYENIRNLFDSFITAAVTVIESRDPSTAGHSQRVSDLTVELAKECDQSSQFEGISFTGDQLEELRYASILHDFGKVGVREEVLLKANKLHPWELERVEWRFRLAAIQAELEHLRRGTSLDERMSQLDRDLNLVRQMNTPRYRFSERDVEALAAISGRWLLSESGEPVIEQAEIQRLCIPYGSLDHDERLEIQRHVEHTYQFLKVIPWTSNLKNIPNLAYAHHEKLDGTGYPRGLVEAEIPFGAKLMTISDIFDALTAGDRPYKASMPITRAVSILREEAGAGRLNHAAVELFVAKKVWTSIGMS